MIFFTGLLPLPEQMADCTPPPVHFYRFPDSVICMKPLVVLGVTGSIAAVRCFGLCRELRRKGFEVQIVMSGAALDIVTEQAMEFASGRKVVSRLTGKIEHVRLFGKKGRASLLLVAPATANTISKIAMGIDDTPVTTMATVAIGSGKPVLLAPAMHRPMYEHPIVGENLRRLGNRGVRVIEPLMADGKAKLADIEGIVFEVERALRHGGPKGTWKLSGKKVLVASGAFSEKIDEVRVLTNLSSGKMGSAIAGACALGGAEVKMVGNGARAGFIDFEEAYSADELEKKVVKELGAGYDYFFCPAAIPDFEVRMARGKLDSGRKIQLTLTPREKMLRKIRDKFPRVKIIAFKALWGKSKKEIQSVAGKFRRENGFHAVAATDLKKFPPGSDETEVFLCGPVHAWLKGKKAQIAEGIVKRAVR